jgi:uncharacterized iron-regulated membrane protein
MEQSSHGAWPRCAATIFHGAAHFELIIPLSSVQDMLMTITPNAALARAALYRTIWRWHFYGGLFVMPFILILSITGAIYLFKPQIDRWEERAFQGLPTAQASAPAAQVDAALAAFEGATFDSYRLPERAGDAAMIHIGLADGRSMRDVFVSPQGKVLGSFDPDARWSDFISRVHGTLLVGKFGSWLVELAACWAIVLILSGLYLWWPRGRAMAGVVWPRLGGEGRLFWRDLHAVTGFWVSGLALVLLVSGLPWTEVWGDAFTAVREQAGWIKAKPDWKRSDHHADHDHAAMMNAQAAGVPTIGLNTIVARAARFELAAPIFVKPPSADAPMAWTIKSQSQNRTVNQTIKIDLATGAETERTGFAQKHPIDQIVGYGISWHEGQLFGWINQLIGVLTAVALITLMVTSFIMWRRRKPADSLGAPPASSTPARIGGVAVILFCLAALLPLLAGSLIPLWLFERWLLPRLPKVSAWLGVMRRPVSP